MKKFKVGILGAGFGERVVLPCVEFIAETQKKLKIKKILNMLLMIIRKF